MGPKPVWNFKFFSYCGSTIERNSILDGLRARSHDIPAEIDKDTGNIMGVREA